MTTHEQSLGAAVALLVHLLQDHREAITALPDCFEMKDSTYETFGALHKVFHDNERSAR